MIPINLEYDPKFLEEEERDGYLVSAEMKKLWLVELNILNKFIQVCEKNSLTYWADAGTLLGAVRHNGFVPWDDDIDVIMPRVDYEKLYEIGQDEFKYPYYLEYVWNGWGFFLKIKRLDTTRISVRKGVVPNFEKKMIQRFPPCISIDIFSLDNCPDTQEERQKYYRAFLTMLRNNIAIGRVFSKCSFNENRFDKFRKIMDYTLDNYTIISKKYNSKTTEYVYNSCIPYYHLRDGFVRKMTDYEGFVYKPFEMLDLKCPVGYENILDVIYTQRTGKPWNEPVKNLGMHNQELDLFLDFDNPYTKYSVNVLSGPNIPRYNPNKQQ